MIITRSVELDADAAAIAELVRRAAGGEPRAFRRLMAAYQDAFLKIHHNLAALERPEAFFPWARRILVNTALDHIRRVRRARAVETESDENLEERAESDVEPPDRRVEEREFFRKIERALKVLPPRQREVVLLHDVEGFTTEEISERLEIPRATVRSNLFYGREKLRRMLAGYRGNV